MKKIGIVAVACALALTLAACSSGSGSSASKSASASAASASASASAASASASASAASKSASASAASASASAASTTSGNVYTNSALKMTYTLPAGYEFASQEELDANNTAGASQQMVMMAKDGGIGPDNVNIIVAQSATAAASLNKEYLESLASELDSQYQSMGGSLKDSAVGTFEIGGQSYLALRLYATLQGANLYQQQIYVIEGPNIGIITATADEEEDLDVILSGLGRI